MMKVYEMTQEDYARILEACKPKPAMFISGGTPMFRSVQEMANEAWKALGDKMGFKYMTVVPNPDGGPTTFFAEPKNEVDE